MLWVAEADNDGWLGNIRPLHICGGPAGSSFDGISGVVRNLFPSFAHVHREDSSFRHVKIGPCAIAQHEYHRDADDFFSAYHVIFPSAMAVSSDTMAWRSWL